MGYRHYFYMIPLEELEKVRKMSYDELFHYADVHGWVDEDDGICFRKSFNQEELYELGKLYFDDTSERICETGTPMFENEKTQEYFKYYDPYVVGKSGLECAINICREKILNYFKGLVTKECANKDVMEFSVNPEDLNISDVCRELYGKISIWSNFFGCCPINMDESDPCITNSWIYEYSIFELVRIYKTVDWDRYTILFY